MGPDFPARYIAEIPIITARNTRFDIVKIARYFPQLLPVPATYLKLMRLAMEAISVPRPPMLVPTINPCILSVNPDRRIAAGTLLIIWLAAADTIISRPVTIFCIHSLKAPMRPILPINIKSAAKVPRSE